jgi:hypothetical protein
VILIEHGFAVKGKRHTEDQTACIALAIQAYNTGRDAKNPALSARALAELIWRASGLLTVSVDGESILARNCALRLVIVDDDEVMPAVRAWLAFFEAQSTLTETKKE